MNRNHPILNCLRARMKRLRTRVKGWLRNKFFWTTLVLVVLEFLRAIPSSYLDAHPWLKAWLPAFISGTTVIVNSLGTENMDESQLAHLNWIIAGGAIFILIGVICYIVNLVMLAVLCTKIKNLSDCINKLFAWFDQRPCERHESLLTTVEERLDRYETRINHLEEKE